jgi:hypothetical protein
MFSIILVLVVGLTLPLINVIGTANVGNFLADFGLGAVAEKFIHGASMTNIVFESVNKLLVCFHGINIGNKQSASNE